MQPSEELLRVSELLVSAFQYQKDVERLQDIVHVERLDEAKFDRTENFWTLLICYLAKLEKT